MNQKTRKINAAWKQGCLVWFSSSSPLPSQFQCAQAVPTPFDGQSARIRAGGGGRLRYRPTAEMDPWNPFRGWDARKSAILYGCYSVFFIGDGYAEFRQNSFGLMFAWGFSRFSRVIWMLLYTATTSWPTLRRKVTILVKRKNEHRRCILVLDS